MEDEACDRRRSARVIDEVPLGNQAVWIHERFCPLGGAASPPAQRDAIRPTANVDE